MVETEKIASIKEITYNLCSYVFKKNLFILLALIGNVVAPTPSDSELGNEEQQPAREQKAREQQASSRGSTRTQNMTRSPQDEIPLTLLRTNGGQEGELSMSTAVAVRPRRIVVPPQADDAWRQFEQLIRPEYSWTSSQQQASENILTGEMINKMIYVQPLTLLYLIPMGLSYGALKLLGFRPEYYSSISTIIGMIMPLHKLDMFIIHIKTFRFYETKTDIISGLPLYFLIIIGLWCVFARIFMQMSKRNYITYAPTIGIVVILLIYDMRMLKLQDSPDFIQYTRNQYIHENIIVNFKKSDVQFLAIFAPIYSIFCILFSIGPRTRYNFILCNKLSIISTFFLIDFMTYDESHKTCYLLKFIADINLNRTRRGVY